MGVRGARSMMEADPLRFCETFTWNWGGANGGGGEEVEEEERLALLVDAMSVLHLLAKQQQQHTHNNNLTTHPKCPAAIQKCVASYMEDLLLVVGSKGAVHIFLDGLCPAEKIPSQISRLSEQASAGDKLARTKGDKRNHHKVPLHLFAEWAFIEGVQAVQQQQQQQQTTAGSFSTNNNLFLHRATMGEGEAYINDWMLRHSHQYSKIRILSEDSDFLVYGACPGFIPPSTIQLEKQQQHDKRCCFQGRHYLRSKFLNSFLPNEEEEANNNNYYYYCLLMSTVAALAGCDYVLSASEESALNAFRNTIISSDIGGLRPKHRKNATAKLSLQAILRVIAHHKRHATCTNDWLDRLVGEDNANKKKTKKTTKKKTTTRADLKNIFLRMQQIYFNTLQVPNNTTTSSVLDPSVVDVYRLLKYGTLYCFPLIETWEKADRVAQPFGVDRKRLRGGEETNPFDCSLDDATMSTNHEIWCLPPLASQVKKRMAHSSIWAMPHFQQIRKRLYCLIRLNGLNPTQNQTNFLGDLWCMDKNRNIQVTEFVRTGSANQIAMKECQVDILALDPVLISNDLFQQLFQTEDVLQIDRATMFCVMGTGNHHLSNEMNMNATEINSIVVLASLMLPHDLACFLILMATAPLSLDDCLLPTPDNEVISDVNRLLPVLSVACYHALFVANAVSILWKEDHRLSSPTSRQSFKASETFRHERAFWVWENLREGLHLEEDVCTQATTREEETVMICSQMDKIFKKLCALNVGDHTQDSWENLLDGWKEKAMGPWSLWWNMFRSRPI